MLSNKITPTLIISTFNWPQALELCLLSVIKQSILPSEIIIADDGSGNETRLLVDNFRNKFSIPLLHVWHEDKGFRKTIILNEAIRHSNGNYIIQIDGDIILQKHFIKDHVINATIGNFIKGSRARLMAKKTIEVLQKKIISFNPFTKGLASTINATRLTILSPLFYGNPHLSRRVKGCNLAFWKDDFIAVNGYNNDLEGWGHEDIELAARLVNAGVKCKQLKMVAVCYHLFHKINSRDNENVNLKVYEYTIANNIKYCHNGYKKL